MVELAPAGSAFGDPALLWTMPRMVAVNPLARRVWGLFLGFLGVFVVFTCIFGDTALLRTMPRMVAGNLLARRGLWGFGV